MTTDAKKSNKPADPPYAGGEDEGSKSPSQPSEPPVDESDDGPELRLQQSRGLVDSDFKTRPVT